MFDTQHPARALVLLLGAITVSTAPAHAQDRPAGGKLAPAADRAIPVDEADLNERVTPEVKAVRRAENSVVSIYVHARDPRFRQAPIEGQGSGVIIDASGLVITNWHVAAHAAARQDAYWLQVRLKDKRDYPARILNVSRENDLALLQLELPPSEEVKPVTIGDSDTLMVGETVIAIGNPQGHANTVTRGVLSAVDREITARTPDGNVLQLKGLLQTDAAINQGNSGGALLDITGKLIGINNAMATNAENIGFAIPVNTVHRVFQELLVGSANFSLWLGLQLDETEGALLVSAVDSGSPAEQAGLKVGDRLVAAAQRPIESAVDYARALMTAQPGRAFSLSVRRGARELELKPVPQPPTMGKIARAIGVQIEEVSDDQRLLLAASRAFSDGLRRNYRLSLLVRVTSVDPAGTAAATGVRPGDVLLYWIDNSPWGGGRQPFQGITGVAQLLAAASGRDIEVAVLRDGEVLVGPLSVR